MAVHDPNNDAIVRFATGNSIELMLQLLDEETKNIRGKVRHCGQVVREFFQHHFSRKDLYATNLLKIASKANPIQLEDIEKHNLNDFFKIESKSYTVPIRTFVDLAYVLLNDEEDGVICRLALRNPKWKKLPNYVLIESKEDDACDFQLWNRPMGSPCTMPDDDEERLSLPSTRATDWGREKMDTVEAQLALLTRQMQHLLQLQQQQRVEIPAVASQTQSPIQLSDSSEDEGRGASLRSVINSPRLARKEVALKTISTIPLVAAPSSPAPPPPPPELLKSTNFKSIGQQKCEKTQQRPVRPTADDLKKAIEKGLRKVESRSPGGTPQGKQRKGSGKDLENPTDSLAKALLERFRSMNGSFSEQEEHETSWVDDE